MNQAFKRKLFFRSKNRGCKETDILLGKFADNMLNALPDDEVMLYAEFLDEDDGDIYKWLTGTLQLPEKYNNSLGRKILGFDFHKDHKDTKCN